MHTYSHDTCLHLEISTVHGPPVLPIIFTPNMDTPSCILRLLNGVQVKSQVREY